MKAQFVHAGLVNKQMTITDNINNSLINRFVDQFSHGKSVRIMDFALKKGSYDRGDAKYYTCCWRKLQLKVQRKFRKITNFHQIPLPMNYWHQTIPTKLALLQLLSLHSNKTLDNMN